MRFVSVLCCDIPFNEKLCVASSKRHYIQQYSKINIFIFRITDLDSKKHLGLNRGIVGLLSKMIFDRGYCIVASILRAEVEMCITEERKTVRDFTIVTTSDKLKHTVLITNPVDFVQTYVTRLMKVSIVCRATAVFCKRHPVVITVIYIYESQIDAPCQCLADIVL